MPAWIDREQTATYQAETAWEAACQPDGYVIDDLADCRRQLDGLVNPVLLDRVTFEQIKGNTGKTLGQLVYTEWYQWRLRVVLPVQPATLVHEAAHLLIESCGGTDLHNVDFRRVHLWLVRQKYGPRLAGRLANIYRAHGLVS